MFHRDKWLNREKRLHPVWCATWNFQNQIQNQNLGTCIRKGCDDLREVVMSNSKNLKHRMSLRLAGHLLGGISRLHKLHVDKIYEECVQQMFENCSSSSINELQDEVVRRENFANASSSIEDVNVGFGETRLTLPPKDISTQHMVYEPSNVAELTQNDESDVLRSTYNLQEQTYNIVLSEAANENELLVNNGEVQIVHETVEDFFGGIELEEVTDRNNRVMKKNIPFRDEYKNYPSSSIRKRSKKKVTCDAVWRKRIKKRWINFDSLRRRDLLLKTSCFNHENVNSSVLQAFLRNLKTRQDVIDTAMFRQERRNPRSSPIEISIDVENSSPDRYLQNVTSPHRIDDENNLPSDISNDDDFNMIDDRVLTSTPKSKTDHCVCRKRAKKCFKSIYVKCQSSRLKINPRHLILSNNLFVDSDDGDAFSVSNKFELIQEYLMEKIMICWKNDKQVTMKTLTEITERKLNPAKIILALQKLDKKKYIILLRSSDNRICDIIRGAVPYKKYFNYYRHSI